MKVDRNSDPTPATKKMAAGQGTVVVVNHCHIDDEELEPAVVPDWPNTKNGSASAAATDNALALMGLAVAEVMVGSLSPVPAGAPSEAGSDKQEVLGARAMDVGVSAIEFAKDATSTVREFASAALTAKAEVIAKTEENHRLQVQALATQNTNANNALAPSALAILLLVAHFMKCVDPVKAGHDFINILSGATSGPVYLDEWVAGRLGIPTVVTTPNQVWRLVVLFTYGLMDCYRSPSSVVPAILGNSEVVAAMKRRLQEFPKDDN
ncbi:hypothetical protein HXX76_015834 [Chlamydomonas incerta]|uniref:Uncharacterized protein n=1 Tax=Chlamydomonas incerta TaxID=51695 RepID=A0A835SG23_CHLIN|nr:hypothetical protein HXX76_015834 [Chlamydomonas incerta]|eukprot:KAG2422748.1 hypothetical protein HXX76_015834 [Chlamydomonas incerta]